MTKLEVVMKEVATSAFLIKHLSDEIEKIGNQICQQYGLTIGQMRLLGSLYFSEPDCCSMKELEQIFFVSQATMQGLVNRTAKKGLVQISADKTDKRRKNVYLTQKGRDLYKSAYKKVGTLETALTNRLSPTEAEQLNLLLRKIIN